MVFDLSDPTTFDSDYFLKLAVTCRHNAMVLRDGAKLLFENEHSKNHGLFLLHTAFEEFQKGIFCLFVYRGFMTPQQVEPIFFKHESKIILFEKIFNTPDFRVVDGKFHLGLTPLSSLNFQNLIENNRDFGREYMIKRNNCLYVRPDSSGDCYTPSRILSDADQQNEEIIDKLTALNGVYELIMNNDFDGDFGNFYYYKLTPKGKPDNHNITFSGSGILKPRTNFKPTWLDDYVKKLISKT